MRSQGYDVTVEVLPYGLLAVQGPGMVKALQPGLEGLELTKLPFMTSALATAFGIPECRVTRCGYTGEDGVEVSASQGLHSFTFSFVFKSIYLF